MTVGQLITLLQTFDANAEVIIPERSNSFGLVGDVEHDWAAPHPEGFYLAYRDETNARLMVRLLPEHCPSAGAA